MTLPVNQLGHVGLSVGDLAATPDSSGRTCGGDLEQEQARTVIVPIGLAAVAAGLLQCFI